MELPPPLPPAPAFKDQRTGLIVFGLLLLLFGAGLFFSAIAIALAGFFPAPAQVTSSPPPTVASAITTSLMGALLITLGLGSFRRRRWARALILVGAWISLCAGLLALPLMVMQAAGMEQIFRQMEAAQPTDAPPMPQAFIVVMQVLLVATSVLFYVILPAVVIWFYRRPAVRLTCEAHDPVERWTDRVPLPVLALVLLQAFGGAMLLTNIPVYGRAFLGFGHLLTGAVSYASWILFGLGSLAAAVGCARLNRTVWLAYVVVLLLGTVSTIVSFASVDITDYYRAAGLSEQQIALITAQPIGRSGVMTAIAAVSGAAMLAFTLSLHRHFARVTPASSP